MTEGEVVAQEGLGEVTRPLLGLGPPLSSLARAPAMTVSVISGLSKIFSLKLNYYYFLIDSLKN